MFKLEGPSMALNDPRVGRGNNIRKFQMWNNWNIQANENRQHIINWVAHVAQEAGGKLKNLVLSCHGLPGYLQLGEGFNNTHMGLFAGWKGMVEKIWLPNCLVARIPESAEASQYKKDFPGLGIGDGNVFCSNLAKMVGCYVVAATEMQCDTFGTVPKNMMTSFEGLVLSYGPQGNVTWSNRNPSIVMNSNGSCQSVPN